MEQLNLFEVLYEKYHITHKIRLIELFGGIGSQSKALEVLEEQGKLPMGFEHYRLVEFDKYPVASYNAIHGTHFEPTDITKIHASDLGIVERDKYDYLMTYSFPCQDLSLAGKGRGMVKGSGTRSGLLWEVERLLDECGAELPHILMMENVPNVVGLKNIEDFKSWVRFLESKGYYCYYKILNAKDYGIPQNRQRCFMISILGEAYYEFPKEIPLNLKLKDMLENDDEVDKKYYLSKKMIDYICADNEKWVGNNEKSIINKTIASTINTGEGHRRCDASNFISKDFEDDFNIKEIFKNKCVNETLQKNDLEKIKDVAYLDGYNRSIKTDGISKTITTRVDASNNDFLLIKNANKKGYLEAYEGDAVDISSRMEHHRGTVQKGISQTIKTAIEVGVVDKELKIRKLTPKECWRLMGFFDEDYEKAAKVNSNAQLYKQAGNSIVVNVLVALFSQLL